MAPLTGNLSRDRVVRWIEHMRKERPSPLPDEAKFNTNDLSVEDRELILKLLRCHPKLLRKYDRCPPPTTTGVKHHIHITYFV